VLSAAFLIFFVYAGFGKITAASEEVKDAYKNIPRAIITAVAVCAVLYTLPGFVAVGVSGSDVLSSMRFLSAPLVYVMLSTGFRSAFLVVAIGAVAATSSVVLIQMLGISRTIYANVCEQPASFFSSGCPSEVQDSLPS
jgi:APA family basic amino acid/polyamine antiporter